MEKKEIKKGIRTFCMLLMIMVFFFSSFIITAGELDYYPAIIEKLNMPAQVIENLAIHMENRYFYELYFYFSHNVGDGHLKFKKYNVIPEFIEEDTDEAYKKVTGKWTIVYGKEQEYKETINLKPDSMFLSFRTDYLLAREEDQLIYIPIENERILIYKKEYIYQFSEEFMEELQRMKNDWGEM